MLSALGEMAIANPVFAHSQLPSLVRFSQPILYICTCSSFSDFLVHLIFSFAPSKVVFFLLANFRMRNLFSFPISMLFCVVVLLKCDCNDLSIQD